MEHVDWVEQLEIICSVKGKFGVKINFDDFGLDNPVGAGQPGDGTDDDWEQFVKLVKINFNDVEARDLLSSVINDCLILFDTEKEARKLIQCIHLGSAEDDIYFSFISPTNGCQY
jgi:hypothetical protein